MSLKMFFEVFGGLGLFLFGMRVMSDGLQKIAGSRMRHILEKVTSNRVVAVLVGALITAIIQSSSATTVMTVGLVNAGLLTFFQSLGIILGANIGTTITAQIIAFNLTGVALPAIGIGVFVRLLAKREQTRFWGDFLVGFGLIFYGMLVMKAGVGPMKDAAWVSDLCANFAAQPVLGVAAGMLITMLLQSSSATVALTIALASSGVIDFVGAAALVLGENIGTTITAQLAAIGTSVSAKRVAVSHTLFNVFGVATVLLVFPWYVDFVEYTTTRFTGDASIERLIANFHTMFNVVNCLFFLPLMKVLEKAAIFLMPGETTPRRFRLESLDDSVFSTIPVALDEGRQEVTYMADEVMEMLRKVQDVIFQGKGRDFTRVFDEVKEKENYVDALQKEINFYLTELSRKSITEKDSREVFSMIYMVSNLEKIGDHIESLAKLSNRRNDYNLEFSEEGIRALHEIYAHTMKYLETIVEAVKHTPGKLMDDVRRYESSLNTMRWEMRKNHMDRLQAATCNADAGLVYVDMINSFEKIGDHAYNIAEALTGLK